MLAGILTFIQKQEIAASIGDNDTGLMVAGRGFEPLAFRLCSCEHCISKQAKTIYNQDLNTH